MTAMAVAYLDACGDRFVHSATYLNCAVDYEDAGSLATVFADPATLESLTRRMERHGYLPGKDIAHTFDLLRANDLVFRYVVDSWLMGEPPPAFDLLAWNADSTNLPGRAHAEFLRRAVPRERARARRVRGDGGAADAVGDRDRLLHRGRRRRPHRSVARVVPHDPAVQGPGALRHDVGRPHRRHREPAGPEGAALDERRAPARRGRVAGGCGRTAATPGGATGRRGWPTAAATLRTPPTIGSEQHPATDDAPGRYVRS